MTSHSTSLLTAGVSRESKKSREAFQVGFEPTTSQLPADRSTTELEIKKGVFR